MIDKKYIIRVLGRMICFVAVLALATACTGDELLNSSANGAEQEGLSISLTLDGMQLASRSDGEPALNEDAVKRMDVFLFGPNETFMKYATSGNGSTSVEKVTLYQGSSWKDVFEDASQYTLYVLANYKGGGGFKCNQYCTRVERFGSHRQGYCPVGRYESGYRYKYKYLCR